MEHGDHDAIKRSYEDFLKQSSLDVILPNAQDINADSLLRKHAEELQRTPSRTHIFFDEIATVHVILRSTVPVQSVQDLLPFLELTTAAYATNASNDTGDAGSVASKHEIVVDKVAATQSEKIVKIGTGCHAAWSRSIHVARPRARLQRPAVYITATLALKANFLEQAARAQKHYLPSFQALPVNVLESLSLSTQDEEKLYLSEARITKVSPPSPRSDEGLRPLRGATRRAFIAVPAIIPRLRCSALADKVFVSLQIEASQMLAGNVTIDDVTLRVSGAIAESIGGAEKSPTLRPGDEIATIFRVSQVRTIERSATTGVTSIAIKATASLEQGPVINLSLAWQTQIDLSKESSTTYSSWNGRPTSQPSESLRRSKPGSNDQLIFDFSAPKSVEIGKTFDVKVKCVNQTKQAKHLAVKLDEGQEQSRNALATSPDIRLSAIEPGECFEAGIRYEAFASGVLELGQLRIVDLDSGESIKVQSLPDVVAHG